MKMYDLPDNANRNKPIQRTCSDPFSKIALNTKIAEKFPGDSMYQIKPDESYTNKTIT